MIVDNHSVFFSFYSQHLESGMETHAWQPEASQPMGFHVAAQCLVM